MFNQNKIAAPLLPLTVGAGKSFSGAISQGLLSALFAFEGWIVVTNLANEVKIQNVTFQKRLSLACLRSH